MKLYQKQLLALLNTTGWELQAIDTETEWWSAEQWKLLSMKANFGLVVWIDFLVDPSYMGTEKLSHVWGIGASSCQPDHRLEAERGIAHLSMQKGQFAPKVDAFVRAINSWRDHHSIA